MQKRLLSLALALVFAIALIPCSVSAAGADGAAVFTDVAETDWFYDDVMFVYEAGLMVGTGSGAFSPDAPLTKAMAATVLARAAGVDTTAGDTWYSAAAAWAAALGISIGADLEAPITRFEIASMLYVYAGNASGDSAAIMAWAAEQGIITDGRGEDTAKRSEFAAILNRFCNQSSGLMAGAGNGEIIFTEEVFASNIEGFSGEIDSNPYARILLIEDGEKVAIVSLELVAVSSDMVTTIKEIVSEITGTSAGNIWVHCNHTITTPHAPSAESELAAYNVAVTTAVTEAAQEAAASFQSATLSITTGTCDVNANRDIEIDGVQYYGVAPTEDRAYSGVTSTGYSNKTVTLICFDDADGNPIGMYFNYGIKPTAVDNAEKATNGRVISSDVTGLACVMMEAEYDCPVMFVMPAAGDQIPAEETMFYAKNEDGTITQHELTVAEGLEIVDRLGTELGETVIGMASGAMTTLTDTSVHTSKTAYTYENKAGDGTVSIDISALTIGDELAFIGFKPELNAVTEKQLQEASPYTYTLLTSFLDGDQKYMPDESAYDVQSWEYARSGFGRGCAEKFVEVSVELLTNMKNGVYTSAGDDSSSGGQYLGGSVTMGGYTWTILTESDGKYLVLCDEIVAYRAYQEDGSAVTWENSDIRAYLNGEFLENTFTAEEQALIIESEISNPANLHYGIDGGSATTDRVFLLDLEEAEAYLNGTDIIVINDSDGNPVWWYLRSPGEAKDVAAGVTTSGAIDYHGTAVGMSEADAIRPAMWVSTEAAAQ